MNTFRYCCPFHKEMEIWWWWDSIHARHRDPVLIERHRDPLELRSLDDIQRFVHALYTRHAHLNAEDSQ